MLLLIIGIGLIVVCLTSVAYYLGKSGARERRSAQVPANNTMQEMQTRIDSLTNELRHTLEDPITGLPGWQLFQDRLIQQINESARYQFTLGVLYVDINDFKLVNNAVSEDAGNAVLRETAKRLQQCIRQVDSVTRYAKDTFVIALTQLAKPETAAVVTQRILQSLGELFQIDGHEISITVCIGIAIYPADGTDAGRLLRNAAHALGLAKKKGKHGYQFYQQKMLADSQRALALYTGLSRDTISNELSLFYQPVINVQNQSVVCMDALLHWACPDFGLIGPAELSVLMEKQRKATLMLEWMLENACKQFLQWRQLGFQPQLLGVSVSIHQIQNNRFIYRLSQILQQLEFNPAWLLLAIRDGVEQPSFDILEKAFNMLTYIGVNLAIDQFGAGSLPLRYLKHFSIRYLRLDPLLVTDIVTNPQALTLVESIVALAKNQSMQLIVPGVDSVQQAAVLRELGCLFMQGQATGVMLSAQEVTAQMIVPIN